MDIANIVNNIIYGMRGMSLDYIRSSALNSLSSGKSYSMPTINIPRLSSGASSEDLLKAFVAIMLADLNAYDRQLMNFLAEKGLNNDAILSIILANNAVSLRSICNKNNVYGSDYVTVADLKIKSEMHKINNNFKSHNY